MIPLVNADPGLAVDVVFSEDDDIKLREGESPRPLRVLRRDEVAELGPKALIVTVRALNSDEQFACTGGFRSLTRSEGLAAAAHRASARAIVRALGPGVDARTADEAAAFLMRLPLLYREELGEWVLNESTGIRDPFESRR